MYNFKSFRTSGIYAHTKSKIHRSQHGFVVGKSTLTNLIEYSNYLAESTARGGQVDTIYSDFAKAFDQVSHNLLLQRLKNYGIDGDLLSWFSSYLIDRSQLVVIGSTKSNRINPTSGIPQGSILGPLLFLLFIKNLPEVFQSPRASLFADDLKLYKKILQAADCQLLQSDIDLLSNWCRTHRLNLNVDKCFSLTTSLKQNQIKFDYRINDIILTELTVKDDLGIRFNHRHSFKQNNDKVTKKAYQMIEFIFGSTKSFNNPASLIRLYCAYVRSRLEYCTPVWSPMYSTYISSIEKVQRRFTRMLYHKFRWTWKTDLSFFSNAHHFNYHKVTDFQLLDFGEPLCSSSESENIFHYELIQLSNRLCIGPN